LFAIPRSEVGMYISVQHIRIMFPLRAAQPRHSLPHVVGPTASEYYEVIWLPFRPSNRLLAVGRLYPVATGSRTGLPSSWCISLYMPRPQTPAESPVPSHVPGPSSRLPHTVSRRLLLSIVTKLNSFARGASRITACTVPCVRLHYFIRSFSSSIVPTLGMSGWLVLAQRRLPLRKMHQASLGAHGVNLVGNSHSHRRQPAGRYKRNNSSCRFQFWMHDDWGHHKCIPRSRSQWNSWWDYRCPYPRRMSEWYFLHHPDQPRPACRRRWNNLLSRFQCGWCDDPIRHKGDYQDLKADLRSIDITNFRFTYGPYIDASPSFFLNIRAIFEFWVCIKCRRKMRFWSLVVGRSVR